MTKNIFTADISKRIKTLREANKISQEKMAELLGMTVSNYIKVENAYQNVTILHLKKICEVLKVPSDILLFGKNDNDYGLTFNDFIKWASLFSDIELKNTIDKCKEIQSLKKVKDYT